MLSEGILTECPLSTLDGKGDSATLLISSREGKRNTIQKPKNKMIVVRVGVLKAAEPAAGFGLSRGGSCCRMNRGLGGRFREGADI